MLKFTDIYVFFLFFYVPQGRAKEVGPMRVHAPTQAGREHLLKTRTGHLHI